jgi:hypothetical protein
MFEWEKRYTSMGHEISPIRMHWLSTSHLGAKLWFLTKTSLLQLRHEVMRSSSCAKLKPHLVTLVGFASNLVFHGSFPFLSGRHTVDVSKSNVLSWWSMYMVKNKTTLMRWSININWWKTKLMIIDNIQLVITLWYPIDNIHFGKIKLMILSMILSMIFHVQHY